MAIFIPEQFGHHRHSLDNTGALELRDPGKVAAAFIFGEYGPLTFNSTITSDPGVLYDEEGAKFPDVAGKQINTAAPLDFPQSEGSVHIRFRKNTSDSYGGLLDDQHTSGWSGSKGLALLIKNSSSLNFVVGGANIVINAGLTNTEWHNLSLLFSNGSATGVVLDGQEISAPATAPGAFVVSPNNLRVGTYYDASAYRGLKGHVEYAIVYNYRATVDEAIVHQQNPYNRILKPYSNYSLLNTVAASGPTLAMQGFPA